MKSLMSQTIRGVNRTLFTGRFILHRYYSILLPGTKNKLIGDDSQSTSEHRDSNEGIDERSIKMFSVEANTLGSRLRSKQYQLQCIAGDAMHKEDLHPQSMVCVNIGIDDQGSVNWNYMVPQVNNTVSLGSVAVAFEGITPGSNLVRPGSAVVRYHLLFKNDAMTEDDLLTFLVCVAILVSIVAAIKISLISAGQIHVYESDTTEKQYPETHTIIINTAKSGKLDKSDKKERSNNSGSSNSSSSYSSTNDSSSSTGVAKSSSSE